MSRARGAMVAQKTVEAFVLRTHDFGEADRVVVLASGEEGRIDGVAKGARRMKSRYGSALEPLSFVRATYRERPGRDLVALDRVELLASSFELLSTPETLDLYSHASELAQTVVMPGEGSPRLVRLLQALLDAGRALRSGGEVPPPPLALLVLRVYFDVWVARLEGFWPEMTSCAACAKALDGPMRIGVHTQGALCLTCARGHGETTLPLSADGALLAREILARSPLAVTCKGAEERPLEELSRVAAALLSAHLERDLRTMPAPRRAGGRAGRGDEGGRGR